MPKTLAPDAVSAAVGAASGLSIASMLPDNWVFHLIGGFVGAALALAILTPDTLFEAVARLAAGVLCAFIFTNALLDHLAWFPATDNHLTMGTLIGFAAWFVLGAVAKGLQQLKERGISIPKIGGEQ